jgi:hypothetical protein
MKKQRHQKVEPDVNLRLWTYSEALKLVPYLREVVRSLRDNWLEMGNARQRIRRIEARSGRADRQTLILKDECQRDVARAEAKLEETLGEMSALSAYCLDPAGGLALIPFRHDGALAWFVFDLFGSQGLTAWRLYSDSLETRRPLAELDKSQSA